MNIKKLWKELKKKIEDFVNEFKEREDNIVEQLIKLKDYKEEKINKNKLNIINEENDKEKEQNDEDGNGKISRAEIEKVLHSSKNSKEVDAIMAKHDANKDGEIDFQEFLSMMKELA